MKIEKDIILELMAEADTRWYENHVGKNDYRKHLEFTADYITRNYDKKSKRSSGAKKA